MNIHMPNEDGKEDESEQKGRGRRREMDISERGIGIARRENGLQSKSIEFL